MKSGKSNSSSEEGGFYLILFTLLAVILLGIGVMALDYANAYRTRLILQKVLDLGVVGGLAQRVRLGPSTGDATREDPAGNGTYRDLIISQIGTILQRNAAVYNIDIPAPSAAADTPTVTYTSPVGGDEQIQVDLNFDFDFRFSDIIPLNGVFEGLTFPTSVTLGLEADAQLQDAFVELMLDVSGSMQCPSSDVAGARCECLTDGTGCTFLDSKYARLREGAEIFLRRFRDGRDHVGVFEFNIVARQLQAIGAAHDADAIVAGLPDSTDFANRVVSNTNIADAFLQAYEDLEDGVGGTATIGNENFSVVLFSDGAPTAGRMIFANEDTAALPVNDVFSPGGNARDYTFYKITFEVPGSQPFSATTALVASLSFSSPRPPGIAPADFPFIPIGHSDYLPPLLQPATTPGGPLVGRPPFVPACSVQVDQTVVQENEPAPPDNVVSQTRFLRPLEGCLNDFSFNVPGRAGAFGAHDAFGTAGGFSTQDPQFAATFAEQFYNVPIAVADSMRLKRGGNYGTIYVIGLGRHLSPLDVQTANVFEESRCLLRGLGAPTNLHTGAGIDPYQGADVNALCDLDNNPVTALDTVNLDLFRHDIFNTRLAADPRAQYFSDECTAAQTAGIADAVFNCCTLDGSVGNSLCTLDGNAIAPGNAASRSALAVDFTGGTDFNTGLDTYNTLITNTANFGPETLGEYLPTEEPDRLGSLFSRIATKILIRRIVSP